ncbi:DUF1045 domain-containing protein [Rhizobium mongolense]|uniref:2'-5' RNA ligase n=2 Tax=Rhizobium mongolense TaxID=57676 RepID=A0ABR6IXA3_9HYPH|nr:DUF1045 domain-containing protein [Rhizobium mongolense]MBB4232529.1 2'-5' RNA ligase [Rhizobium mongolense]TVZ75032.1 uncharacterized protein DUF1045 [Rhizobium mongolense USDA 1844]
MTRQSIGRRYALYYTPIPEHPLIAEPRRYGFHATLKAPFHLAPGTSRQELESAIRSFAASQRPCPIGPTRIATLGSFFALMPRATAPYLQSFASRIVTEIDRFRAQLTAEHLQRRLRSRLDEAEKTHLVQWGYPYVHDRFRFHMTLTGEVKAEDYGSVAQQLERQFAPLLDEDFRIDAITLFEQENSECDFFAVSRFEFQHSRGGGLSNA